MRTRTYFSLPIVSGLSRGFVSGLFRGLGVALLLAGSSAVATDGTFFTYSVRGGEVRITSYQGLGGPVVVPGTIEGYPVTSIGDLAFSFDERISSIELPDTVRGIGIYAFAGCTSLGVVSLGGNIQTVGDYAFAGCTSLGNVTFSGGMGSIGQLAFNDCSSLRSLHFEGNAPSLGRLAFQGAPLLTVYRLPAATGFGTDYGGRSVVIWDPVIVPYEVRYGVDGDGFGFDITSNDRIRVVVEAAGELGDTGWETIGAVDIIGGGARFRDLAWEEFQQQFYRLRMPR